MQGKSHFTSITVLLVGFAASFASASITSWTCSPNADGVISCQPVGVPSSANGIYHLGITGAQYCVGPQAVGRLSGSIYTDTDLDPTVRVTNSLDNDTDFTWTDYHVNIYMNKTFTISDPAVTDPTDWISAITQPVLSGGQYVGHVDYTGGTGVPIGDNLDFAFTLSFLGSVNYTLELIPSPEPATMSLLVLGAGLLLRRRRR